MMMHKINKQKGYTLLFAVLTAVLVLGVAIFILGVARKEYSLSSTTKNSLISIYNADSAVECAVQSDIADQAAPGPISINCDGLSANDSYAVVADQSTVPGYSVNTGTNAIFGGGQIYTAPAGSNDMYINLPLPSPDVGACAMLRVWKGTGVNGNQVMVINARGYNICDTTLHGPAISPNTVERAMQFTVQ